MQAYADVVFNHKDGGDEVERVRAQIVDWDDRNQPRSEWYQIGAWTRFTFPGRGAAHSSMHWHADHFDALSYNADTNNSSRLYRLKDKQFETEVSYEHGNYDYLMACDLDTRHPQVEGELRWWGRWIVDTTGVNGFRIDAVKHIRSSFFRDWLHHLRVHFGGRELFAVGEYWSGKRRRAARLHRRHRGRDVALRRAAALPLPRGEPRGNELRHEDDLRRHAGRPAAGQGRDVRGQPRQPALPVAGVVGRALVQAAGVRADPAPAGRLPVRVLRRLPRRAVHTTRAATSRCTRTAS